MEDEARLYVLVLCVVIIIRIGVLIRMGALIRKGALYIGRRALN